MNQPNSTLNTYVGIILFSIGSLVTASSVAQEQNNSAKSSYGLIHFNNDKGEEKCALAIPETHNRFHFDRDNEYCENDMVSTFWLENVPSATKIDFFEDGSCSAAVVKENFFFKLKTVKQPTDWTTPAGPTVYSIDALRNARAGELIPKKNIRVEAAFVGSDFANKNLNERLSCVYIERSQPVN